MKKKRHEVILSLIANNAISTQEELLRRLKQEGYDLTQATVSRDIKELRLVKAQDRNGVYRYASAKQPDMPPSPKFIAILENGVVRVDSAMNDIVNKCYAGMAQAACAALDSMELPGVVGTLAGDDTIFAITRSETAAAEIVRQLRSFIRE